MKDHKKESEQPIDEERMEEEVQEPTAEALADEVSTEEDEELTRLKEENQKLKEDFLRAYADAENTKKRCAQEIEKNNKYAISSFAKSLLGVADNLDRALKSIPEDKKDDCEHLKNLLAGVEMTQHELTKVFEKFGIKKMEIIGTKFDPNFHQVIQEVEDKEKANGTIINELQSGYMINDRILREAMVIVSKGGK